MEEIIRRARRLEGNNYVHCQCTLKCTVCQEKIKTILFCDRMCYKL